MKFLESIKYIDYIFSIDEIFEYHDSRKANKIHSYILKTINPDFIITTKQADKYWKNKKIRGEKLGIKFIDIAVGKVHSTTKILEHLLKEL